MGSIVNKIHNCKKYINKNYIFSFKIVFYSYHLLSEHFTYKVNPPKWGVDKSKPNKAVSGFPAPLNPSAF